MESSTDVLPWPLSPLITTSEPSGLIDTAFRRVTFSDCRAMIFIAAVLRWLGRARSACAASGGLGSVRREVLGAGEAIGGREQVALSEEWADDQSQPRHDAGEPIARAVQVQ